MNAPDLIADYYRRDLDEAEEQALAAELQASPEAAERFAALAAADYQRFGLPEPGDSAPGKGRRLGILAVVVLAGAAALAWSLRDERAKVLAVPEASDELREVRRPVAPVSHDEGGNVAAPAAAASLKVSAASALGPFHVSVTGADAQPAGVFDATGRKVGLLRALGARELAWDGRDAQGQPVLPGRYALSVRAGGRVLTKWVEIDVR